MKLKGKDEKEKEKEQIEEKWEWNWHLKKNKRENRKVAEDNEKSRAIREKNIRNLQRENERQKCAFYKRKWD